VQTDTLWQSAVTERAFALITIAGMRFASFEKMRAAHGLGLVAAVLLGSALFGASPAKAWGNVTHRAIVMLAEQQLTPETAKEVRRLLSLENANALTEIVMWADQIRRQEIPGTPQHDVGIPFDAERYDAERDCQNFCIVEAIPRYLTILADRSQPDSARLEALKYVAHLVGDIHQPLHASLDGGSQLVAWDTKTVYLHILWDVTMVSASYPTPELLVQAVAGRIRPRATCGSAEEWANESHGLERSFVYPQLGPERRQPIMVPADYAPKALPIIEERVVLAIERLTCVLNKALDPRRHATP